MHKYQFLKADIKPWLKYSFIKKYGIPTKYVDTTLNTNTTNTLTTASGRIKNFKLHANTEQASTTGKNLYGDTLQENTPTPDTPVAIQSVTGRQVIKITGTNIFKMEDFETTDYGIDIKCENNLLTLNGTQGSTPDGSRYVSLLSNNKGNYQNYVGGDYITLPAGTYTAKFIHISGTMENYTPTLAFCSGNDNPKPYLLRIQPGNTGSFTLTEDTIVRACINFKNNINNYKCRITLTNNGSSTDELYVEKKYEVNLGNIKLNKIGNYEDEFVIPHEPYNPNGKWYLKKNIGKMVFNGRESGWGDRPNYTYADRFIKDSVFPTNNRNMYCNYFRVNLSTDNTYPYLTNNGTQCTINFSAKGTTTLAQFKEWLSTHNTIIYYVLATPQYILLNDTLQSQLNAIENTMRSYKNQTNITVETNMDTTFDLSYKTIDS